MNGIAPAPHVRMLVAIDRLTAIKGYPPAIRELQAECGYRTTSAVVYMLRQLERRGIIERQPALCRTLRVTDAGRAMLAELSGDA